VGAFVDRSEGMPEKGSQRQLYRRESGKGCCSETRIEVVKPDDIGERSSGVKVIFTVRGSLASE
jgi:hypothetical protein